MHVRCTFAVFLVIASLTACAKPPAAPVAATETAPAPVAVAVSPDDRSRVLDELTTQRKANVAGRDPTPLMAMFADDADVCVARSAEKAWTDLHFAKKRLNAIYQWAARNEKEAHTVRLDETKVSGVGDRIVVEWHAVEEGRTETYDFGERYEFAKRAGAWKIVAFRYWPLMEGTGKEFDFQALDQKVEDARARGDRREEAYYLMGAYRFEECARVARLITEQTPEEPWCWEMRAIASAMMGDEEDADRSMRRAESLHGADAARAP